MSSVTTGTELLFTPMEMTIESKMEAMGHLLSYHLPGLRQPYPQRCHFGLKLRAPGISRLRGGLSQEKLLHPPEDCLCREGPPACLPPTETSSTKEGSLVHREDGKSDARPKAQMALSQAIVFLGPPSFPPQNISYTSETTYTPPTSQGEGIPASAHGFL